MMPEDFRWSYALAGAFICMVVVPLLFGAAFSLLSLILPWSLLRFLAHALGLGY